MKKVWFFAGTVAVAMLSVALLPMSSLALVISPGFSVTEEMAIDYSEVYITVTGGEGITQFAVGNNDAFFAWIDDDRFDQTPEGWGGTLVGKSDTGEWTRYDDDSQIDWLSGIASFDSYSYAFFFYEDEGAPLTNDYYNGFVGGTMMMASPFGAYTSTGEILSGEVEHVSSTPTPEPATVLLFGTGIAGLIGSRIRKKRVL